MDNPIILALDGMDLELALGIVKRTKGAVWGYKINDLFYDFNNDPLEILNEISECGHIMFDLKLHDIPNTVVNYCERIKRWPVDIVTVHASGGWEMINAASSTLKNQDGTSKVAAVTVLTSLNNTLCASVYHMDVNEQVACLAMIAKDAGAGYLVCSPKELPLLSGYMIRKIVPGIRPSWYQNKDDQKRVTTPLEAILGGADKLVIGRPITKSSDPVKAAQDTLKEIEKG